MNLNSLCRTSIFLRPVYKKYYIMFLEKWKGGRNLVVRKYFVEKCKNKEGENVFLKNNIIVHRKSH